LPLDQAGWPSVGSLGFSYLWCMVTLLPFHLQFCFALLSISYGWQHPCSSPTSATLRLSSPAEPLDWVYLSYHPRLGILLLVSYGYLPLPQLASHCQLAPHAPGAATVRSSVVLCRGIALTPRGMSTPWARVITFRQHMLGTILIGARRQMILDCCLCFRFRRYFPFFPVNDWFHFVT